MAHTKNPSTKDSSANLGFEADLVDCMVALPGQLFYNTQIPVCLWSLEKNKNADAIRDFLNSRQQIFFFDARKLGTLTDRVSLFSQN